MIQLKQKRVKNHTTDKFRIVFLKYSDAENYTIAEMFSSSNLEDLFNLENTPPMESAVVTNLYAGQQDQYELYVGLTVQAYRRTMILKQIEDARGVIDHWESLRV